jgi:PAS domain S-box-containing protein
MGLGLILFIGGLLIIAGLYFWLRQREQLGIVPNAEQQAMGNLPLAASDEAVLVSREHGQLIYINERARKMLGLNGGEPNLEYIARQAQPTDSFLDLFAGEGQASFQLGARWVEASSHNIPSAGEVRRVVVLRELSANTSSPDALDLSLAMNTINEIGETVNASMSVQQVHQALLSIVMKVISADAGEICLWDEAKKTLHPEGWVGDSAYLIRLQENGGGYRSGEGITGWIAQHRKPVLVASIYDGSTVQPKIPGYFKSYVGVPLTLGSRFIGTFELGDARPNRFGQADLALLQAISKQIATAIYNAQLYGDQSQRITEMAALPDVPTQSESGQIDNRAVYRALNERISRLISAGVVGVLLYDDKRRALLPELPFHGLPDSAAQKIIIALPPDSPQRDIWESQSYWVTNDVADNSLIEVLGLKELFAVSGVRSMALLPLDIGRRRIGMMQISNKRAAGGFTAQDIREMRLLVSQAAIVVENLRLFQQEQQRDTELSGLREITQAIGSLNREGEFYSAITESIAKLMSIGMCGILLYDSSQRRLTSRLPFYGLADDDVRDYVINLEPGSPLAALWDESEYWISNRAQTDAVVHAAGLADYASKLGVQKTLLAKLTVGGREIGVVQASNKLNGEDFTDKDAQLLLIFATQAAAIIENARLLRDTERAAAEATRLRQVVELAGAVMTPEDSFTPVLAEISMLTRSPIVYINVLDQQTGSLITYPRWVYGTELHEPVVFDIYSKHFEQSVALSHEPFMSNDLKGDPRVLETYRTNAQRFGLTSTVLVPLVLGDHSLGELGIANRADAPYTADDVELMSAIASQIAATVERLRLIEAQGQNLRRRLQELDAISNISNELAQRLDLEYILDVIRHEAARATGASGSTIALLRPQDQWRQADVAEMDIRIGEKNLMPLLTDIEIEAVNRGATPVLVSNYATSAMTPQPPFARSAIAAAFLYEDKLVGVIHLFHTDANHFDDRAVAFLMTLAAKASLGYGNGRRFNEQLERSARLRKRIDQLSQIYELGQMLQGNIDQISLLEAILYSIQQSVGFDLGMVSLVDEYAGVLRRVVQVGMPLDIFESSRPLTISLENVKTLLQPPYQISESYFFPVEGRARWDVPQLEALRMDFPGKRSLNPLEELRAWQEGDLLLVPLMGPGGNILGLMTLDRPQDGLRPDRSTMEVLEIFAHQAAAQMENIRLYLASVENAEQEARLNEVMETVTSTLDIVEIVEATAYGALRLVPFNSMSVALVTPEQNGFDIIRVDTRGDGTLTPVREQRSSLDNTALMRSMADGQDALYYAGDAAVAQYQDLQEWHAQGETATLIIPLVAGGVTLGAIHFGSDLAQSFGFEEYRPMLKRLSNFASVAMQNARLFNQALNLQVFTESVVESIQQGIVVLDRSGRILSMNEFMHQRYGWNEQDAQNRDLFAYRPDLAALLKDDLYAVLETGEPRERIGQNSYQEDDRLTVRNFYLYPLRSTNSVSGVVLLVEDVSDRAILERDLEARATQLSVLTEVSSRITASLDRDAVINLALDEMGRVIPYDTMTIWSRSGDMLILEGQRGFDEEVAIAADADTTLTIASHERLRTLVERKTPYSISNLQGWDALPGEHGAKSWLGVPLVNQQTVVGVIALSRQEARAYDDQSEQAAFAFANQVAIALANATLYTEAQHRTERLGLLNRVSVSLAQSLDSENILEIALHEISQSLGITYARALVFERDLQVGRVVVVLPRGDTPPDEVINLQKNAAYQIIRRSAGPLLVEDVNTLPEGDVLRSDLTARKVRAYAMIPMTVGGQAIGAFELEVPDQARAFTAEQVDLGMIIANQAAIAVQNTNLLEQTLVRTRELETLLEAAQATSLTLNLEGAYRSVCELILHALDMDDCAVMLWDNVENALEVMMDLGHGEETDQVAPQGSMFNLRQYPTKRRVLNEREIVVVRSTQADSEEAEELRQLGASVRVLIPLVVRDQAIGLLQAQLKAPHRAFSHREVRLAQALGAQAAIAIQNARLSTETAALVEEGFIINNLSQAIASTLTIDDMISIVRDNIPRVTDAEELYLALYDPVSQMIDFPVAVRGGEDFSIPPRALNNDEVSFIIRHRRSLVLGGGNFSSDEMRRNLNVSNGEGNIRSYLGVPVASGDQVLGVLAVRDMQNARAFGINDERLLTTVGTQLGAAMQNARMFQQISNFADELNTRVEERTLELQRERDRIDTLYRITSELARSLDMDRVLRRALEMVAGAINAEDGLILLLDPLSDRLVTRAGLYNAAGEAHPAEMLANWLLQNERTVMVPDLERAPYWDLNFPGAARWGSGLAVLLESNDDPQGVLVMLSTEKFAFSEVQLKLVVAAANQVAAAINNADLYHLIRDQAERLGTLVRVEQEEAEKNSAIVESIADGVMLADAEGAIVLFNQAAERILELPRDQVIGQTMFKLTGLFGGSADDWTVAIDKWAQDPESYKPGEYLEETLDLGKRVVSVHLSPVYTGERFLGTVSVFRDITKEVEVDRVKSQFVSNVSHELRTPMTSIKGFADLLLMGVAGQVTDPQKDFLLKIKGNADRLSQLVNDLLNISKIDAGERLNFEIVDLGELIPNALAAVQARAEHEHKQMGLALEIEPALPPIEADAHKLTQIITNILDNAFNYTYAGGSIEVKAGLTGGDKRVLISVKDTGIGIPEEFRDRIWGRFERYEDHALVMDVPGTGLGLSIVKELVERHNGSIWFESEMGKGTTFYIELPVEQPV